MFLLLQEDTNSIFTSMTLFASFVDDDCGLCSLFCKLSSVESTIFMLEFFLVRKYCVTALIPVFNLTSRPFQ